MVSEDSDEIASGFPAVHGLGDLGDPDEPLRTLVDAAINQVDAVREFLEVRALRRAQRISGEERNDRLPQVHSRPDHVPMQWLLVVVVPAIHDHHADPKEVHELMEATDARGPLRDRELVRHLPSGSVGASTSTAGLAHEADREASFSVYETDHPSTLLDQPFLLIVRTVRIVTAHSRSLGRVPDGYTGFPAFGRMRTALLPGRGAAISATLGRL
jgi:hypothetical protein